MLLAKRHSYRNILLNILPIILGVVRALGSMLRSDVAPNPVLKGSVFCHLWRHCCPSGEGKASSLLSQIRGWDSVDDVCQMCRWDAYSHLRPYAMKCSLLHSGVSDCLISNISNKIHRWNDAHPSALLICLSVQFESYNLSLSNGTITAFNAAVSVFL